MSLEDRTDHIATEYPSTSSSHSETSQRRRLSHTLANEARNALETVSQASIDFSKQAAKKAGSFLGISRDEDVMQRWKERCSQRAQDGHVGLNLYDVIAARPSRSDQTLALLQEAMSPISVSNKADGSVVQQLLQEDTDLLSRHSEDPPSSRHTVYPMPLTNLQAADTTMSDSRPDDVIVATAKGTLRHNERPSFGVEYVSSEYEAGQEGTSKEVEGMVGKQHSVPTLPQDVATIKEGKARFSAESQPAVTDGSEQELHHAVSLEPSVHISPSSKGTSVTFSNVVSQLDDLNPRSVTSLPTESAPPAEESLSTESAPLPTLPSKSILKSPSPSGDDSVDKYPVGKPRPLFIHDDVSSHLTSSVDSDNQEQFLYRSEGLEYYQHFIKVEQQYKKKKLLIKKTRLQRRLLEKQQIIDEVLAMARVHYFDSAEKASRGWYQLLKQLKDLGYRARSYATPVSDNADVRIQMEEMPQYRPWFTYVICLLQVITFCIVVGFGHFSRVGLEPELQLRSGIRTFQGLETMQHWKLPNIWVGPDPLFFLGFGAVYAPCMRTDYGLALVAARSSYNESTQLGCCEVALRDTAGTTTQSECHNMTSGVGKWMEDVECSYRQASQRLIPQIIKPCCHGNKARCNLTTWQHCFFLQGLFHSNGPDHCSQVDCVSQLCSLSTANVPRLVQHINDSDHWQWWRILLSIFYHHGVVHLVLVVVVQFVICHQMETAAGWFRVGIIYIICASMGLVIGAVFSPYVAHVGGGGAVFGMIGVMYVEIFQSWSIIPSPRRELLKLAVVTVIFLLSGTLPYVDNFVLIGGFVYGILTGIIFLPYITFGRWHAMRKKLLIAVAVPLTVFLTLLIFFIFYYVQSIPANCPVCNYFNCIPYTRSMCKLLDV